MRLRFRVIQDGMVVASAEGMDAEREIMHYAFVYAQDGPVRVERFLRSRWREIPHLAASVGQP